MKSKELQITLNSDCEKESELMSHLEKFKFGKGFQARSLEIRRLMIVGLQADKCQSKSGVLLGAQIDKPAINLPAPDAGKVFNVPGVENFKYSFSKSQKILLPFTEKSREVSATFLPEVLSIPEVSKPQTISDQNQLPSFYEKNSTGLEVALIESIPQTEVGFPDNEQSLAPGMLDSVASLHSQLFSSQS